MPGETKKNVNVKGLLKTKIAETKARLDGWVNFLTGAGVQGLDKRVSTSFIRNVPLTAAQLLSLYRYDGLSKRIIDVVVYDMLREGFVINGDEEGMVYKKLRSLKAMRHFKLGLTWADLLGGSLIVMGLSDGQELDQELNENNIDNVEFLRVYDCEQVTIETTKQYDDPKLPKYGQPKLYTVNSVLSGQTFDVHETRVLRFDGVLLDDTSLLENNGWGDSRLQAVYERIKGLSSSYTNIEEIIEEFIQGVLKIDDMAGLIASGREKELHDRLMFLDLSKHMLNTTMIDKNEEFDRLTTTVTGVGDLLTKLELALSGFTGIPSSLLFGQSPKGLNASGEEEGQIRLYYDKVASRQEEKLSPQLERLVYLIMKSKQGGTNGKELEDWDIVFNPLWQPSQKEIVESRRIQAETDEKYWKMTALSENEIAKSRFGGMDYSYETTLSDTHKAALDNEELPNNTGTENNETDID